MHGAAVCHGLAKVCAHFLNGDATLWKSDATHDIDGTIRVELEPRYDWAAARFEESGATVQFHSLRVTHLFRKEEGGWKLLHRHADPLMSKTAPADVLSA